MTPRTSFSPLWTIMVFYTVLKSLSQIPGTVMATNFNPLDAILAPYLAQDFRRRNGSEEVRKYFNQNQNYQQSYSRQDSAGQGFKPISGNNLHSPDPDIALVLIPYSRSRGLPVGFPFCDCRRCPNDSPLPPTRKDYVDSYSNYSSNARVNVPNSITRTESRVRSPPTRVGSTIYDAQNGVQVPIDENKYKKSQRPPLVNKDVRFRYPELY